MKDIIHRIGSIVKIDVWGSVIDGEIIGVKETRRWFKKHRQYKVVYGVDCLGHKTQDESIWLDEENVLKLKKIV